MPLKTSKYIWHEGKLVPWEQATVHVLSHALHYGSSVFEGIRVYKTPNGAAGFRLTDHVRRLYQLGEDLSHEDPVRARYARDGVPRRRARERLGQWRLHPADRVSRLRRDGRGRQHRAAGERLGRRLGMGLVSWAKAASSKASTSASRRGSALRRTRSLPSPKPAATTCRARS